MSDLSRKIAAACSMPAVAAGIAQVFLAKMRDHLDDNMGRGPGGSTQQHAPLKPVYGYRWTSKVESGEEIVRTKALPNGGVLYYTRTASYRNGGQPLRNTGDLYRNLQAEGAKVGDSIRVTLKGPQYGLYQDRGFTTSGPNYLPLSLKGVRQHATGGRERDLKFGRDFTVRKKGVTVPARPFLLPTRAEMTEVGKSIYLSLKSTLKGK